MTHIQIPHLIREKIKDYLSFTEWRDKMTQVCIEYHKKAEYTGIYLYEGCDLGYLLYKNNLLKYLYNFRFQKGICTVYSSYVRNCGRTICKLSPNY